MNATPHPPSASRAAPQGSGAAPRVLCVVVHDVAPANRVRCEQLLRCLRSEAPGLPVTLLAVPRYHLQPPQRAFDQWLDTARRSGHELALHGYTHRDDGVPHNLVDQWRRLAYTAGEGEFCDLPRLDADLRLQEGVRWFQRNGWPLHGFVAPAWLLSPGTWDALAALPFQYTCTLSQVVALPSRQALRSQSIVYSTRAAWRRVVSLGWNRAVAHLQRRQPLLRLELHPGDIEHASIRDSWLRILREALRDRQPATLAQAVRLLQPGAADAAAAGQCQAASTMPAVVAPIAAPTSTSLG
jgi:predicted deacetylase